MPGIRTDSYGTGDQRWLGSTHGIYNGRSSSLDVSAFTKNTHYPEGYIPSGLPVDASDEAALKPWTGDTGQKLGFVLTDARVVGDDEQINVAVLRHGTINVDHLPVDFTAPTGGGQFVFVGSEA